MRIFICRICGEVYLGREIPPSCPFCGVENKYLALGNVWKFEDNIEITAKERENLEKALELEMSNTKFYKCVSKTVPDSQLAKMFKGLSRVEKEHADVFRKILKRDDFPKVHESCNEDIEKCLSGSLLREKGAVEFYQKALSEAETPRVKEVLEAIMKVEKDHIELDEAISNKY